MIGAPAPQALFELGGEAGLSGYEYKEFVGDRAALIRTVAGYTFPVLRAPIRLPGLLILPGLSPGVAVGIHGGWTEISSERARQAVLELGAPYDIEGNPSIPIPVATGGMRASAEFLVTFFSGALAVGVTWAIDQPDKWKFTGRIGQGF